MRCLALLAILFAAFSSVHAKSAEDYYHGAAYQYVAGKIQDASVEAEEGLRLHPGDAKLQALAEQIRKMKDQQRGNSGNNGENQKDRKDPKNQNDGKGQDKQDKQNKQNENEKSPDDENKNGDKQNEKPEAPEPEENAGESGNDGREAPGKMSEAEAKRLLNSFADDEKKEQAERRRVLRPRAGTEQAW